MGMIQLGNRSYEEYQAWLQSPQGQQAAQAENARVQAQGGYRYSNDGMVHPPRGWAEGNAPSRLPEPFYAPQKPKPDYTGRLPEPGYGPQKTGFINPSVGPEPRQGWGDAFPSGPLPPSTPQTLPGDWMYNKTNTTPAFNPVLPTPKPAPPRSGQAQSAPPPASQYRAGGPGGLVGNFTPLPRRIDEPRGVPSVPSFGPGSKPVPSFGPAPGDRPRSSFSPFDPKNPNKQYEEIQAWVATMPKNERGDPYGTRYAQGAGASRAPAASASPRPPAPSLRTADRYTRPEGYVPNSTLWAQHTPTPEPEPAPYNPNPPRAPKPNVIPKMQMGPSSSYLSGPGSSTTATWDQAKNKMGPAYASGGMTMNANMANPGGESMRPQGFTFTAKGVDGKQYANPADAMARRDALINNLGQQQARYSGSMGRNLGAPQFNMKQAMGQGAQR